MYYHSIQVLGRLTRDIELQKSKAKSSYVQVPIAVNEKDKDGKDVAFFYDLLIFGSPAESIVKLAKKGDLIFAIGKPRFDAFMSKKEKQAKAVAKVLVDSWQLIK